MTGELSLTGRVLPVGRIKDKLLGALKAGRTHILLSEHNRAEFDRIDEDVKKLFTVQFFTQYEDLYEYVFQKKLPPPLSTGTITTSTKISLDPDESEDVKITLKE